MNIFKFVLYERKNFFILSVMSLCMSSCAKYVLKSYSSGRYSCILRFCHTVSDCPTENSFSLQEDCEKEKKKKRKMAIQEREKKEQEEKNELISICNKNKSLQNSKVSTWKINNYVDSFGDKTKERYITNSEAINGKFDNSATTNSNLRVVFLIDGYYSAAIKLYEYNSNHPVKSYKENNYRIYIKIKDQVHNLGGRNYKSDRISLTRESSFKLNKELLQNRKIRFHVREDDSPSTQYNFNINNKGYCNVFPKLVKNKK